MIQRQFASHDKRRWIVFTCIFLVALAFWLGSRYPSLNEKALMGESTALSGLGFDTLIRPDESASLQTQIAITSINWLYTNRQGMTFGIVIAPLLMMAFSLFQARGFQNRIANVLMGVAVGSPLGVCVNCATPIARGIQATGARLETALAVLLSSPTLNIVVLTMLFSFFPVYVGVLKVSLTIVVIFIGIPLIVRFQPEGKLANINNLQPSGAAGLLGFDSGSSPSYILDDRWRTGAKWVGQQYWRYFWFIVRKTVPWMILSGFIGAALVTLLPLESLEAQLPRVGPVVTLIFMVGLGLLGALLPVPMAFDVIVVAVLYFAGLPIKYALVLLSSLGIFSIYPFILIWRDISKFVALSLLVLIIGLSTVSGVAGHYYSSWSNTQQRINVFERFKQDQTGPNLSGHSLFGESASPSLSTAQLTARGFDGQSESESGITVTSALFEQGSQPSRTALTALNGSELGLSVTSDFSVLKMVDPFSYFRGIAAGDVHNDGWTDIAVTSSSGVLLFQNSGGRQFVRQEIALPDLTMGFVLNTALVDINNDGWLDLFLSTYQEGAYVIINEGGEFSAENIQLLPNIEDAVAVTTFAFGDLDSDGDLDIFMGNWSVGEYLLPNMTAPQTSQNVWLENQDGDFVVHQFSELPSETLSSLFWDVNNDGHLDLLVGNDFQGDSVYLGDGNGGLTLLPNDNPLIPHSARTTMSLSIADIDNDLSAELYVGQISFDPARTKQATPEEVCGGEVLRNVIDYDDCLETHTLRAELVESLRAKNSFQCRNVAAEYQEDCVAFYLLWDAARFKRDADMCDYFGEEWALFEQICRQSNSLTIPIPEDAVAESLDFIDNEHNVLLIPENGQYYDSAKDRGIDIGGWTWNAKFADLDNDQWQDLFIVSGIFMYDSRVMSNLFYQNVAGSFEDKTDEYGLTSMLDTLSYVYIDIENDGDLDIVSVPTIGDLIVYRNDLETGNAVAISLEDKLGNRFGIGSSIVITYGENGEHQQIRHMLASGGFSSFEAPIVYFGLGEHEQISRVEIRWPTGKPTIYDGDLSSGAHYQISREE